MKTEILNRMRCPYCLGPFRIGAVVLKRAGRIEYGLVRCRCFEFPIVHGVLMLALWKGYGGAEEKLQPYVPLQATAINFLKAGKLRPLRAWIARHAPLLDRLISPAPLTYVDFAAQARRALDAATGEHLTALARYGALRKTRCVADDYHRARFLSPYGGWLRAVLDPLPRGGSILSLCSGQGIFELIQLARDPASKIVSIDGQMLNLFALRRFVDPEAALICHDLESPLPFRDSEFDLTFSSNCLPEIPCQERFISEAIRATKPRGAALFDWVWIRRDGRDRVDPARYYRTCQNTFRRFEDYAELFDRCASGRRVMVCRPSRADFDLRPVRWSLARGAAISTLGRGTELAAFAVTRRGAGKKMSSAPVLTPRERAMLKLNPYYRFSLEKGKLRVRSRAESASTARPVRSRSIDKARLNDPRSISRLQRQGILAFLPRDFMPAVPSLSDIAGRGAAGGKIR